MYAGYVPPHSRRGDGTSTAGSFSLSHDTSGPGKLGRAQGRALPPGATPPDTKAASKNSKRRSKKKSGPVAGADASTADDDGAADAPAQSNGTAAGQLHYCLHNDILNNKCQVLWSQM